MPESLRVIHMPGVAQLVNHDVTQVLRVQEHQAVVQADRTGAGMAAPASLLATHMHFLKCIIR
jgi:hypothetical protein